jgi:DNA-binding transcriptional LysR family regulator
MEFGTFDGIIGCVGAGLGLTMLPRSVVERSARRREVKVHALPGGTGRMEVTFVTRKGDVSSSALLKFVEVLAAERLAQRSNGRRPQRSKQ